MFNKKSTDMFKPNLNIFLQYFLQAGDINFMNLLVYTLMTAKPMLYESIFTCILFTYTFSGENKNIWSWIFKQGRLKFSIWPGKYGNIYGNGTLLYPLRRRGGILESLCQTVCLSVGWSVGSHILSGLFLTNHWAEFNTILHEASIPRADVHILKGLQLHDVLQSYGPFTI